MSADQDARIHKVISAADGNADNFVFVLRRALEEERAQGREEGYSDALRDQHQAEWLAEARDKRAAMEAAGREERN